ncbi:hypothetical protein EBZ37_04905 [bacterium]|nr:hypothetical protein [bacterium]
MSLALCATGSFSVQVAHEGQHLGFHAAQSMASSQHPSSQVQAPDQPCLICSLSPGQSLHSEMISGADLPAPLYLGVVLLRNVQAFCLYPLSFQARGPPELTA